MDIVIDTGHWICYKIEILFFVFIKDTPSQTKAIEK